MTELLGGADYGTLAGWMRSEIGAVYGPLVIAAVGDHGRGRRSPPGRRRRASSTMALAHPVTRSSLVLAKAAATAVSVVVIALGTFAGLVIGVAIGGGGVDLGISARSPSTSPSSGLRSVPWRWPSARGDGP